MRYGSGMNNHSPSRKITTRHAKQNKNSKYSRPLIHYNQCHSSKKHVQMHYCKFDMKYAVIHNRSAF